MERIEELIKLLKMNRNRFAVGAGISTSNLARMLKGELTITEKTLQKISDAYHVNMEWLKTGEGEVFYEPIPEQETNPDNSSPCFDLATIQGGSGHGTGMEQLMQGMEVGRMLVPGLKTGDGIPYIQVMAQLLTFYLADDSLILPRFQERGTGPILVPLDEYVLLMSFFHAVRLEFGGLRVPFVHVMEFIDTCLVITHQHWKRCAHLLLRD